MKGIFQLLTWILVVASLAAALAFLMARPALAAACPWCFGLQRAADGVYVQDDMVAAERSRVLATVAAAKVQASRFYGSLEHAPRILICADEACYAHLGGEPGTATGSMGSTVLEVSHLGSEQQVFITSGLSDAEIYGRLGFWKFNLGAIPMWFEEGLAVVVADDRAYLLPPGRGDRCMAGPFPDMPATPSEWQQELQQEGDVLYAQSACKVDMWMMRNGGPKAAVTLVDKVAQGQDFSKLFPAG
ncbi:MAG TPA: hypothetical protein VLV87_02400 [Gammaproteobacteria bacterium]|nr:hypothetical protein [Gammaproteobacteria bacterium]